MTSRPRAVVAGASGAIGAEVASRLVSAGWEVIATYRRQPGPDPDVTWTLFNGGAVAGADQLRLALRADARPVAAVICCIGAPSSKRLVAETDPDEFDEVFAANVTAVVQLWQAVCETARAGAAGVVVLGSSTTTALRAGNGAYSAAKAAAEALVATLATEESEYGVRVNMVSPSLVDSPLAEALLVRKGVTDIAGYYSGLPWGRPLSTAEVATVAVDLATAPHWRYASGQVVRLAVRGE